MSRSRARRVALLLAVPILIGLAACAAPQTTFEPASDTTESIDGVYRFIFWLAGVVFVVILGVVLAFSIIFRERPGREAKQFHGNTRLEIVWTLIPVLIVVAIAVPTFKVIVDTTGDPPEGSLIIEATGQQWWFEFEYPEFGFTTANEMHVPVGRSISVNLFSNDVIHSFWAPQLFGKVDMVPGHGNNLFFTPNTARAEPYLGQCVEFCGTSHANMRFRVFVDTQEDFDAWVAAQQAEAATDAAVAAGAEVFATSACIGCHTIQGVSAGVIGPNLSHIGARSTIAAGIMDNNEANLRRWISDPDEAKPGAKMPAFEALLSEQQIGDLAAYLLSLK